GVPRAAGQATADALPTLRGAVPRIPLGRAIGITDPLLRMLRTVPAVRWAERVGSLRRGEDTVGDIELLAPAADPTEALAQLRSLPDIRVLHQSERRFYYFADQGQVHMRVRAPGPRGAPLTYLA